jgi:ubiquinone/menaquinone biosynthesis C-methylase UbiE
MAQDAAEHAGSGRHGRHGQHAHDDIDWASMAGTLSAWDTLEAERYEAIVEWLGVQPGHVVVDVGSGAGGMAAALVAAVGPTGATIIVDSAPELLAIAEDHAGRLGHQLDALRVDLEQQSLSSALGSRDVDLVHASAVVHHLDDEVAALADFAAIVRPGGRVAVVEGGLDNRYLPADCGIGEPGLEGRLSAAVDSWFWSEVRPATATVRPGWGWNMLLTEAGLVDVVSRSFLLDLPPPLDERARRVVRGVFERHLERTDGEDGETLVRLLDDNDPRSIMRRPDVFVLGARTVHAGTVPG